MTELFEFVEIDIDFCDNFFGRSPCTANAPRGRECFNTFQTCQDVENFSRGTKTFRFYGSNTIVERVQGFPLLKSVTKSATTIEPQQALGARGSVQVKLGDMLTTDVGIDPYLKQRTSGAVSSFWGRFLARNRRSYLNRPLRIISGVKSETGNPFQNAVVRNYFIESIEGPTASGDVTIKAVDPLKKLDDALFPIPEQITLLSNIILPSETPDEESGDDSDSFLVSTGDAQKIGLRALFAGGNGAVVRINDELMRVKNQFARRVTIIERGAFNSKIETHDAGENVQPAEVFDGLNFADVVRRLLTVGGVREFLDNDELTSEFQFWLQGTISNNVITEPTSVKKLLSDVVEQNLSFLWFDDRKQKIRFKAVAPERFNEVPPTLSDEFNILANSIKRVDKLSEQVTRCFVYYNRIDVNESGKPKNYRSVFVSANPELEAEENYGRIKTKIIFADWIQDEGNAQRLAFRTVTRFSDGESRIQFSLHNKDIQIQTGDSAKLLSDSLIDEFGDRQPTTVTILKTKEKSDGTIDLTATASLFARDGGQFAFFAPSDYFTRFSEATENEKIRIAFFSNPDGTIDGSNNYKLV